MSGSANGWPRVRLGDVLARSTETVEPTVDQEYREITVRLWGKGVVERGRLLGASLSGRRFVARVGQFIASRIDARNGAMGLVPASLDGALVSNDFPLFDVRAECLLPGYLGWICRTASFVELCSRASEGTTNRVRLKGGDFLGLEIALPPLPEQQRIVTQINSLAAEINAARVLGDRADLESTGIIGATLNRLIPSLSEWPTSQLGTVATIRSGVTLGRSLEGETVSLPYLRVANVQDGWLDLSNVKRVSVLPTEVTKWRLEPGDLLMTEGGDWDKLGRCAVWSSEVADCIHQNHIFCVRADLNRLLPTYLAAYIGSPTGKAYFQSCAKQTTNLASINQRQLRAFPVAVPPLDVQADLIANVNRVRAEVIELGRVQARVRARIDALLPAILDRAFAGAL